MLEAFEPKTMSQHGLRFCFMPRTTLDTPAGCFSGGAPDICWGQGRPLEKGHPMLEQLGMVAAKTYGTIAVIILLLILLLWRIDKWQQRRRQVQEGLRLVNLQRAIAWEKQVEFWEQQFRDDAIFNTVRDIEEDWYRAHG